MTTHGIIPAHERAAWHAQLAPFGQIDATYLPEYHLAYALRIKDSKPLLWHYSDNDGHFVYPFLLTPVAGTSHYDITGIYGYTGPIATRDAVTTRAWQQFDAYAAKQNIIAEFIRFSPFNENQRFAHPGTRIEQNRTLAASNLPLSEEELLQKLGPKTRNMLRKAATAGLAARELALPAGLPAFRALYEDTMNRNKAPEFFWYDDAYYQNLMLLGYGLRLFGVFAGEALVAASMSVSHGASGLYHLGASLPEHAKSGAGNLALFEMSRGLMRAGVTFINMTGGRTMAADDPLLLFKKSNATGTAAFYIGKRILDETAYASVREAWAKEHGDPGTGRIIFWRS